MLYSLHEYSTKSNNGHFLHSLHAHYHHFHLTSSFWSCILDENDKIIFSIDGLEDTNHLYRKNAKWKSIMGGIEMLQKRKCKIIWKFIVFKHNQHQIYQAKQLCEQFSHITFEHVYRKDNKRADQLANLALDS